jgi:isoleucyl-tRNA synthetase
MKTLSEHIGRLSQDEIRSFELNGQLTLETPEGSFVLEAGDMEVSSQDIPGWEVNSFGRLTVALDVTLTPELRNEGLARELVNRIQNLRKEKGLEVTDRISLTISSHPEVNPAVEGNLDYICNEILASSLNIVDDGPNEMADELELDENIRIKVHLKKS